MAFDRASAQEFLSGDTRFIPPPCVCIDLDDEVIYTLRPPSLRGLPKITSL